MIRLSDPYGDCSSDREDMDRDVYAEIYPVDYRTKVCSSISNIILINILLLMLLNLLNFKACENTCFQRKVIEECNCSDPFYPNSGKAFSQSGLPICSVNNFKQGLFVLSRVSFPSDDSITFFNNHK